MDRYTEEPFENGAGATGEEWMRTVEDAVEHGLGELRSAFAAADAWTREMTEQRPLIAIGVALAAGFAVARFLARLRV
jgi:hypothetical protein